jgi:YD repeat-containing protein
VAEQTTGSVNFEGLPVFNMGSRLPTVTGDEKGVGGGVVSGVNLGYCKPLDGHHSTTLRVEDKWLIRHNDILGMNCNGPDGVPNTYGKITYIGVEPMASVDEEGQIIYKEVEITDDGGGGSLVRQAETRRDPATGLETQTFQETRLNPETGRIQTRTMSGTLDPATGEMGNLTRETGDFAPGGLLAPSGASGGGDYPDPVKIATIDPNPETGVSGTIISEPAGDIGDEVSDALNEPAYQAALKEEQALAREIAAIKAEMAKEAAMAALDVAGMVDPTPASDGIAAAMAFSSGDYIGGTLSMVSFIPYLGDALAKPMKAMRTAKKATRLAQNLEKLILKSNKIKNKLAKIKKRLKNPFKKKPKTGGKPPETPDGGHIRGKPKDTEKMEGASAGGGKSGNSRSSESPSDKASDKARQESGGTANAGADKGEPVNCVTGEVFVDQTDFTLPGRIPLEWRRHYGSQNSRPGLCGHGWQTPADARLVKDADGIVTFYDGAEKGRVFASLPGKGPELEVADGAWLARHDDTLRVTLKTGISYHFTGPRDDFDEIPVTRIQDRHGNYLAFERDRGVLQTIRDNCGRRIDIVTTGERIRRMDLVTPYGPSRVLVSYDYNRDGDLLAVYNPLNAAHCFYYENHCLLKHTDRAGLSFYYTYDVTGPGGKCVHTRGDDGLYDYRFDYEAGRTVVTNSLGYKEIYEYDEFRLPFRVTDHAGNQTRYAYDAAGRPTSVTDPSGKRTGYIYNRFGNPIVITRSDAATVTFEYDDRQQPICVTDPNGSQWKQRWDEKGRLIEQITPRGTRERYVYNE